MARIPRVIPATLIVLLGVLTWQQAGMYRNLETLWQKTLARNPDCSMAHNDLGSLLYDQGHIEEAMEHYRKAIQSDPNNCEALINLGIAFAARRQFNEAIENYRRAIEIQPNDCDTLNNLGATLATEGRFDEAIENFRRVIQIYPNHCGALNNLALVLAASPKAEFRNGAEAVRLAKRACELTHYGKPVYLGTLAAAYAEAGRFPEAVATAEKAEQLANTAGLTAVAAKIRQLLELYRAGKPFPKPAPAEQ